MATRGAWVAMAGVLAGCAGLTGMPTITGRPIDDAAACAPMPTATPGEMGIAAATIDSIRRATEAMKSDALLIVRDGKIVHEWTSPYLTMPWNPQSVTKAITGLGVGVLLDRGAIPSLDLPVADVFPEFAAADKRPVTLRMLMNHTSGIAAGRGEAQFNGQPDVGAFVRTRPMAEPAGTTYRYSNVGAQLTGQVVQAKGGAPLHAIVDSALFRPMCIADWRWQTDARGSSYAYARAYLTARDLAKIGQLVLDRGTWRGRRLVRAETIDTLTMIRGGTVTGLAPGSYVGLWEFVGGDSVVVDEALVARLRAVPVSDSLLATVRRLIPDGTARRYGTGRFRLALDSAFGPRNGVARWYRETNGAVFPVRRRSPAQAVEHSGSWGQWLIVFPETRTVVVHYASWDHPGRRREDDGYGWTTIVPDLYRLIGTTRTASTSGR